MCPRNVLIMGQTSCTCKLLTQIQATEGARHC
jgi:hypothetical protein